MKRKLFTLASAVSLLLCVGMAVLWVRSYSAGEQVRWRAGSGGSWFVTVCGGSVMALHADGDATPSRDRALTWVHIPGYAKPPTGGLSLGTSHLGFARGSGMLNLPNVPYQVRIVPLWAVVIAVGVLPVLWAGAEWKRRVRLGRLRAGCCTVCAYDLRATSDRCPECGTEVERANVAPPKE